MSTEELNKYGRILKILNTTSTSVLRKFAEEKLFSEPNLSILSLLKDRKHEFYHSWQQHVPCCLCDSSCPVACKIEACNFPFKEIYIKNNFPLPNHEIKQGRDITRYCVHTFSPKKNITFSDLSLCGIIIILKNIPSLTEKEKLALNDIADINYKMYPSHERRYNTNQMETILYCLNAAVRKLTRPTDLQNVRIQIQNISKSKMDTNEIQLLRDKLSAVSYIFITSNICVT